MSTTNDHSISGGTLGDFADNFFSVLRGTTDFYNQTVRPLWARDQDNPPQPTAPAPTSITAPSGGTNTGGTTGTQVQTGVNWVPIGIAVAGVAVLILLLK